jgi:predicted PurR-regulated permease PerM
VPAVLVALFQPFPLVLWVVLAFIVIQQLESNVLVPRISGHAVGLHPLAAMLVLLVGFEVAGIVGALFAVPLAGIVWVFASTALRARTPS